MFDHLLPQERRALRAALELGYWATVDRDDVLLWGDFDQSFGHVAVGFEIHQLLKDLAPKKVRA